MVDEYYSNPAISQSQLKLLLGPDPSIFNNIDETTAVLYFEEKKHFIIGDGVDIQLTRNLETFNEKFHVSNIANKPSDTMKSIVNQVYDRVKQTTTDPITRIQDYPMAMLQACNDHEYQPRWNDQTRMNKVVECWEYWEDLKSAEGKTVISQEENDLISQIVMSIRTSENTSKYFQPRANVEILYQLSIYFEFEGVSCKALLDMVVVDHQNKTVQPIDIKTLGDNTLNFTKSLRQRRYDIQGAFYTEALRSLPDYLDYTILPFKFIVESTIRPGNPLVYTMNKTLYNIGKFGRKEDIIQSEKGYGNIKVDRIKGFKDLIDDYKWYMENEFRKREIVESGGELTIDWNGIK